MEREKIQEFSPSSASHSRKFEQDSERRNFLKNGGLVRKLANVLRTFGVGVAEVQLLDLSGPRHGRQHPEGVLAVDLFAAADVELQQSTERFEVLELA